ncbi:hypothetical protein DWV06_01290 [Anaerosacchariphilus polymeriproducens]|uniref:Uncharacterized protein n=1 Tax=Anaerosacchariphilus polymeriproducens TaxID=1812858 RepID=A0A371AZB7_9FIRM|nr:hypothetical protein DWV06_01290 [Anaerosacchariphilus polymeriproducens]
MVLTKSKAVKKCLFMQKLKQFYFKSKLRNREQLFVLGLSYSKIKRIAKKLLPSLLIICAIKI